MLIVALQFWAGDVHQSMQLARLIADLETTPRNDVTILFSARFDCPHDMATVEYVRAKFPVVIHTGRLQFTGWPLGCNALMTDTYRFCIDEIDAGRINAESILFAEADAVPLDPDWINKLMAEWKSNNKMVLGSWLTEGDCGCHHINGNCIIHKDFHKIYPGILHVVDGGWDAIHSAPMMANGAPSRLIFSDYHFGTDRNPWNGNCDIMFRARRYVSMTNPLYGQDITPVWLHGPKDLRGIACVRSRFLPSMPNVVIDHVHQNPIPNHRRGVCHRGH